jgi:hypothetical protein
VHVRLVERRTVDGERSRMDDVLAFLDSRWNGFEVELPVAKDPVFFVAPLHALQTDSKGFAFGFRDSAKLAASGDLPFLSIDAYMRFSRAFLDEPAGATDIKKHTPKGIAARRGLDESIAYLIRYKQLIDVLVRAIVAPESPYPAYLALYDYPAGRVADTRGDDAALDVARRHAVLLWAAVGKDPSALADWLHDELLAAPEHAFPKDTSLTVELLLLLRAQEPELLARVVERAAEPDTPDFAREFSPHFDYRVPSGTPGANAVADSHHRFHAPLANAIRQAAHEVVAKELD